MNEAAVDITEGDLSRSPASRNAPCDDEGQDLSVGNVDACQCAAKRMCRFLVCDRDSGGEVKSSDIVVVEYRSGEENEVWTISPRKYEDIPNTELK
jgi:hypothetical protein